MIRRVFIISAMLMLAVCTWAAHEVAAPQNIFARKCVSLNGAWHYFADPQEQGYYDYWMHPVRWGYFRNAKPQRPSDLIEYDFDASPTMQVPGDWNTQDERLFMYEGSVWFCREFQVSGFKFQVKAVVSFNQYEGRPTRRCGSAQVRGVPGTPLPREPCYVREDRRTGRHLSLGAQGLP